MNDEQHPHVPEGAPEDGLIVAFDVLHGVVELILDRPPGNRLSWRLLSRLDHVLHGLAALPADSPVRAAVLAARGADFCHGADLGDAELAGIVAADPARLATLGQRVVETLDRLPIPTIAAVTGRAIGGGACLVTACDFRVVEPAAELRFPEVDRGMHLSWGILPIVARELGAGTARRLTVAGEPLTSAGRPDFAREDSDPLGAALDWARNLAAKPPLAVRSILATLQQGHADDDPARFAATTQSADFVEAMTAYAQKRPGRYGGS
jgi:enoyl-CoA hydratase/carnithine racemase